MDMSDTKTDVASSLVSTLFSTDPLCFDVAKAHEHLDRVTACSDCEYFIDALEEIIDTIKKTGGVLDDINKLRLISEVQCLALKASRRSIRLQNREFKDYIEELKRLNVNKLPITPSPSKAKKSSKQKCSTTSPVPCTSGKKQRAEGRKRSGNTTPPPAPAAAEEGSLSEAMDEESSSDESGSRNPLKRRKSFRPTLARGLLPMAPVTSPTQREMTFRLSLVKRKWLPSLSMQAKIQPGCSIH
ncbi:hypothetical protein TNIN_296761 [Trichonephila inaurata madagascariensis]|uniref:Uncharacterized protein n=1 Tax=Trichonephila inaurata madagascariensis TaxID=2747483 RepID=A0A8X6YJC1_9ARAC|nr:hypothetical protein TNIN_296761 [Trichonephila inaurata madagascariensis]